MLVVRVRLGVRGLRGLGVEDAAGFLVERAGDRLRPLPGDLAEVFGVLTGLKTTTDALGSAFFGLRPLLADVFGVSSVFVLRRGVRPRGLRTGVAVSETILDFFNLKVQGQDEGVCMEGEEKISQ